MARKLLKPLEDPPSASSSGEYEVEDEEQISDSSAEENKPKDPSTETLKSPPTAAKQSPDSDSRSEANSDTEAEPSPKATAVSVSKSKNKEVIDSPTVKSGKKRAGEGSSTDVTAKKAKKVSASGEDNKKVCIQRLWSEEDEVSLLQGMIDFKADTGKSPDDDMNEFFEFVKKAISFEVSKIQFGDKIRELKKKYLGKPKKVKDESFTKPHEKICLKLAKYVWGSDGLGLESAVKSPVQSKKKVDSMVGSSSKSPMKIEKKKKKKKKKMDSMVEEGKEILGSSGIVLESDQSNGKEKNEESLETEGEIVEEVKEVLIHEGGGGSRSPNWFEKSFIVKSLTSPAICMNEYYVKERWSKVRVESKKRIEHKYNLVSAKEFELMSLKADLLRDATTVLCRVIED